MSFQSGRLIPTRTRDGEVLNNMRKTMEGMEVGALDRSQIEETLGVLARGMRDNPMHVAAFGPDPVRREGRLRRLFGRAFDVLDMDRHALVARGRDGQIAGILGMQPPGECRPKLSQRLRLVPCLISVGPRAASRTARWTGAWAKRDPDTPHWHLGPVAVDTDLQGMGVGSRLMRVCAAKVDAAGQVAYLETDEPASIRFFERFGFEIAGEQEVLGNPNWFMVREAKRTARGG